MGRTPRETFPPAPQVLETLIGTRAVVVLWDAGLIFVNAVFRWWHLILCLVP